MPNIKTYLLIAMVSAAVQSVAVQAKEASSDLLAAPIEVTQDVLAVRFVEFARIPDVEGEAPRMMYMLAEPATKRLFLSTMPGMLYNISPDGKQVTPYLDINASRWGVGVQFLGMERGLQSFAFHPQFAQRGTPGYGKFYTYIDTTNTAPAPDFTSNSSSRPHDTVLLEWTAKDPRAAPYDGAGPREIFRTAHPFPNHNGGQIAFNPLAKPGAADFGLLYIGFADGGSGGDPMKLAQNLASAFGKILRIDPLGSNSKNKRYGIPASNPFANDNRDDTLSEIYAYGVRNPQRFTWDAKDGRMLVADIGQDRLEEISPVPAGGNLGWNKWEGSYSYVKRRMFPGSPRSEAGFVWPIVEFDHNDPLLKGLAAITGLVVYRDGEIRPLRNRMIFGDNPSGEIFYVDADTPPKDGRNAIRRILMSEGTAKKTLLQLINEKVATQGKPAVQRADLRFGFGPNGEVFILNKRDGVIRLLVADSAGKAGVS